MWGQHVYANFLPEIDPFNEPTYFRSLNQSYNGNNTYWAKPSPEPHLPDDFLKLVTEQFRNQAVSEAVSRLAASITAWESDYQRLILVAILRAGVPIADWLTRLLPGATAVSMSLFTGLGIDRVAIETLKRDYPQQRILFVDGWTGRGGVSRELAKLGMAPLAVLIDPWGWADFSGSNEDIFCPTACFTGPTTLGFSRTFYVDAESMFAAYLFPERYSRPALVTEWQAACPAPSLSFPLDLGGQSRSTEAHEGRFFKKIALRVHSNEVCRTLINSHPKKIYFADDENYANKQYALLLNLAELRQVPVIFGAKWLNDYQTKVACQLST